MISFIPGMLVYTQTDRRLFSMIYESGATIRNEAKEKYVWILGYVINKIKYIWKTNMNLVWV